ncbi:glycosyltransferase family 4 protein [Ferrimicrobium acidiphilum]|uniref:GDP-mannose-dependent alpha-(1-6)-phosphatidylinositol dimannoside mannosyltransferase n=1 Tax=Ferrimicrobium acidiphilum DSM 19497 TaxID=1121877 RepID=A0A0D8FQK3_9ACTN|nr:glycosyltransferase family 4 protein [Ferrimicrobium acidiphilum]KJE75558.1 GDP-mannose-dependent alpha-(1-6)-phosphatidylinositol dimannoside mannosyltransferase [Ferrimicrobium acidiphilum DSM 19497]
MRILIYNWRDLTHPKAGGAEVYTDAVARVWSKEGHEVTLFTSAVPGQSDDEVGVGGYRIVRRGGRLGVYREARRFWMREGHGNFDFVIDEVNTKPFGCPEWVKDVPVVALIHQVAREIWLHETWLPVALLGRFWLERRWLASYRDTTTVTVSASSKQSLEAYGLRNVTIVPEGMDPMPASLMSDPPHKEETLTFAFVGRLSSNKRPHHALEAFKIVHRQFPKARLWVMGTGPMEAKLRSRAPDGVEFLGWVSDAEKLERLGRVHALLVTSVREGWGLVVTEAAMVGTPSIGYKVPGLCDSISASDGLLSDTDPFALAEVIIASVSDLMTANRSPKVRGVTTWSEVAARLIALVADAVGEHAQPSGLTPAGLSVVDEADGSRRAG